MLHAEYPIKNCPSDGHASASNSTCKVVAIFREYITTLNQISHNDLSVSHFHNQQCSSLMYSLNNIYLFRVSSTCCFFLYVY
jgi:hypothetical protein